MSEAKRPMAEANRISDMLNRVLGTHRFPVKIDELALEYSRQCFPDSPIDRVQGEALEGFDGLLKANKARSKWLILYNSASPSEGRMRFTIAHELGHVMQGRNWEPADGTAPGRPFEKEPDAWAARWGFPRTEEVDEYIRGKWTNGFDTDRPQELSEGGK